MFVGVVLEITKVLIKLMHAESGVFGPLSRASLVTLGLSPKIWSQLS